MKTFHRKWITKTEKKNELKQTNHENIASVLY